MKVWSWPRKRREVAAIAAARKIEEAHLERAAALWAELELALEEKRSLETDAKVQAFKTSKLVVGCTTSGASKYWCAPTSHLQARFASGGELPRQ